VRRLLTILFLAAGLLLTRGAAAEAAAQKVVSPQGIEAWLIEDHGNPLISLAIGFHGGAASDPAGREGLARLAASLLDEGAGEMKSAAFQEKLADLGIDFGFSADQDDFTGQMRMLTQHRDEAFDLLRLALTAPRFDADAISRMKAQMLSSIAIDAADPGTVAYRAWMRLELGDHPYTHPVKGTPASIAAITAADLRGFVAQRLGRDQMRIAVVGDINAGELAALLDRTFGSLPAKAAPLAVPEAHPAAKGGVAVIERDLAQSIAVFGQAGIDRADPDFYAAVLLDDIMGGGNFKARLMDSLREKRGLVYYVGTGLAVYDHAALVTGSLGTKNATAGQAIDLVRSEWQRMHDEGPSAAELADAKTHVIGAYPLNFTSTWSSASALLDLALSGRPIDYAEKRPALFAAVTLADAKRVAHRLYDPSALRFLVLGRPEGVTATLSSPTAGE
jgi:zinc protease